MVITEYYRTREDGVVLVKTYSNKNFMISQDGTGRLYEEAIDPEFMSRTYTETDIPIESVGTSEEVLNVLLGGES